MSPRKGKGWTGPNGVEYTTFREMCIDYRINESTVKSRLRHGKSLSEALEKVDDSSDSETDNTRKKKVNSFKRVNISERIKLSTAVVDHLGNRYKTLNDMLHHYGISIRSYQKRLRSNWTLEEILTTPMHKERVMKYTDVVDLGYRKHKDIQKN